MKSKATRIRLTVRYISALTSLKLANIIQFDNIIIDYKYNTMISKSPFMMNKRDTYIKVMITYILIVIIYLKLMLY